MVGWKKTDVVDVWFKQKNITHPENQLVEFMSLFNNDISISLNNELVTAMTSTLLLVISNNANLFNGII